MQKEIKPQGSVRDYVDALVPKELVHRDAIIRFYVLAIGISNIEISDISDFIAFLGKEANASPEKLNHSIDVGVRGGHPVEKQVEMMTEIFLTGKTGETEETSIKKAAISKRHVDHAVEVVMNAHDVDEACAIDILYLRTRNRWTADLEKELIDLHKAGIPPNIMEFGCTVETGEALLSQAEEVLASRS